MAQERYDYLKRISKNIITINSDNNLTMTKKTTGDGHDEQRLVKDAKKNILDLFKVTGNEIISQPLGKGE